MINVMIDYPLTFNPLFQERIWGGRGLQTLFGKALPAGVPIGESWELADLPNAQSVVLNGPLKGRTLQSLMEQYGAEIVGRPDFSGSFPLLIKLLDADDVLSVQVHPDAETCRRMGTGEPKTECLYIIAAEPDAVIYKGLKPGTTRDDFAQAVRQGTCADLLNRVPVKAGQCHFLPSGTCHAIGKGLVIAEIQEPSDTTYRVFDWNRVDPQTGRARQLHIEEALESICFNGCPTTPPAISGRLVDAREFKIDKSQVSSGEKVHLKSGIMQVLIAIDGAGQIDTEHSRPVEFSAGQTLLIPAACKSTLQANCDTTYLTITL